MKKAPEAGEWTAAHRREALRRTYELAAERAGEDRDISRTMGQLMAKHTTEATCETERRWRAHLAGAFDPARIDREVRRVRGLAEGRLVRETGWGNRYETSDGATTCSSLRSEAQAAAERVKARRGIAVVRVTRVRRAS